MKVRELVEKLLQEDPLADVEFMANIPTDSVMAPLEAQQQPVTGLLWFSPTKSNDKSGTVIMWGPLVDRHNAEAIRGAEGHRGVCGINCNCGERCYHHRQK